MLALAFSTSSKLRTRDPALTGSAFLFHALKSYTLEAIINT